MWGGNWGRTILLTGGFSLEAEKVYGTEWLLLLRKPSLNVGGANKREAFPQFRLGS